MEHHVNLVPWQLLAKGLRQIEVPASTKEGELDLSQTERYFTSKTKIVSLTHMLMWPINPIKKISEQLRKLMQYSL